MLNKELLKLSVRKTGLKFKDFAKEAEMSSNSLYSVLNKGHGMSFDIAVKIAKTLDKYDVVKLEDFIQTMTK